jgi:hypothetical protein
MERKSGLLPCLHSFSFFSFKPIQAPLRFGLASIVHLANRSEFTLWLFSKKLRLFILRHQ